MCISVFEAMAIQSPISLNDFCISVACDFGVSPKICWAMHKKKCQRHTALWIIRSNAITKEIELIKKLSIVHLFYSSISLVYLQFAESFLFCLIVCSCVSSICGAFEFREQHPRHNLFRIQQKMKRISFEQIYHGYHSRIRN